MRMNFVAIFLCALVLQGKPLRAEEKSWTPQQQEIIDLASKGPMTLQENFEAWADGYHGDWTYWRLGAKETRPRDVHMGLVGDYLDTGAQIVSFEFDPVDVVVRGDMAVLRYNAVERIKEPGKEELREVRFSSVGVYVKDSGRWKILSSNLYYAPAP